MIDHSVGELMSAAVTRADIERTAWRLSGWTVDQRSLDELLTVVDRYVETKTKQAPKVEPDCWKVGHVPCCVVPEPRRAVRPSGGLKSEATNKGPANPEDIRECRACGLLKAIAEGFHRDKKGRGGFKTICKKCDGRRKLGKKATIVAREAREAVA